MCTSEFFKSFSTMRRVDTLHLQYIQLSSTMHQLKVQTATSTIPRAISWQSICSNFSKQTPSKTIATILLHIITYLYRINVRQVFENTILTATRECNFPTFQNLIVLSLVDRRNRAPLAVWHHLILLIFSSISKLFRQSN